MGQLLARFRSWFSEPTHAKVPEWQVEQRRDGTVYSGFFVLSKVGGQVSQQIQGRIVERPGLPTEVYICCPPPELRQHPKGPCLQLVSPNSSWFRLHWEQPAYDFDSSRAYIERLLYEAVSKKG